MAKSANIGDPLKEGEVLLSNFLEVLDKRFLVSSLFSPLRTSFRDNVDVNILPYVVETFTLQAANYIGGLLSRLPQGASLDANDRMFGGALPELKELIRGDITSPFDLKQFREIVQKNINRGSEDSKKLINEILTANPKTKGQVVDLIRNHAMNLKDPKEKDALLSAFGLNIPELMVNYMLQRMTRVFAERTKSVEAANNIANARWDKTRDAINKIYS